MLGREVREEGRIGEMMSKGREGVDKDRNWRRHNY